MNKKMVIGTLTTLGIVAASMASIGSVYADTTATTATPAAGQTSVAITAKAQLFKQFKDAITNNDFATFEGLYKTKTGSGITQDSFNKIVQLEALHKQEVQIRTDLKTAGVKMFGEGRRGMRGRGHHGKKTAPVTAGTEVQNDK